VPDHVFLQSQGSGRPTILEHGGHEATSSLAGGEKRLSVAPEESGAREPAPERVKQ